MGAVKEKHLNWLTDEEFELETGSFLSDLEREELDLMNNIVYLLEKALSDGLIGLQYARDLVASPKEAEKWIRDNLNIDIYDM